MACPSPSPSWAKLQRDIASCDKCIKRWSTEVVSPLALGEIPDPPGEVKLLFVGVAPTPNQGRNKGGHFYSTANDPLRVQLFEMLDTLMEPKPNLTDRNTSSKEDGNNAFHGLGLFFVHSAKVRPIGKKSSPGHAVMRFCSAQHLAHEIQTLDPPVVCFLGATNATPAAVGLFGKTLRTGLVADATLSPSWRGKVVLSSQPLRAGKATAPIFLREALKEAGYTVRQLTT